MVVVDGHGASEVAMALSGSRRNCWRTGAMGRMRAESFLEKVRADFKICIRQQESKKGLAEARRGRCTGPIGKWPLSALDAVARCTRFLPKSHSCAILSRYRRTVKARGTFPTGKID